MSSEATTASALQLPPDARLAFAAACIEHVTPWVTSELEEEGLRPTVNSALRALWDMAEGSEVKKEAIEEVRRRLEDFANSYENPLGLHVISYVTAVLHACDLALGQSDSIRWVVENTLEVAEAQAFYEQADPRLLEPGVVSSPADLPDVSGHPWAKDERRYQERAIAVLQAKGRVVRQELLKA